LKKLRPILPMTSPSLRCNADKQAESGWHHTRVNCEVNGMAVLRRGPKV